VRAALFLRFSAVAAAAAVLGGCAAARPPGTLAFSGVVHGRPGIYEVDATGGHLRRVAAAGTQLAWSPDGKVLAFVRNQGLWLASGPYAVRRVVPGPVDEFTWSPDGSRIAYRGDDLTLSVATTSGTVSGLTADARAPAWSPDGRLIAFVTSVAHVNDQGEDEYVAVVRPDGSGRTRLQLAFTTGVAWSPDSKRLAFAAPESGLGFHGGSLYTMRSDGTDLRVVVPRARFDPQGGGWSPDGSRIAYADAAGTWVVDADGGHLHRVSPLEYASWSPDGRWLAVQGARVIDVVAAAGGKARRVIVAGSIDSVAWRPSR
jgi:Tol biopolymer transport system component